MVRFPTTLNKEEAEYMTNKADILLHPVRMKIIRTLLAHNEEGFSPLEMTQKIQDVSQATLYRHIQKLADAEIIRIVKSEKKRAVTENYYTVNMQEVQLDPKEWNTYSIEEKLNYYSYYQFSLLNQYQTYLNKIESENMIDLSTLSMIDLNLDNHTLKNFQDDLQALMMKYYKQSKETAINEAEMRTIGITIIP